MKTGPDHVPGALGAGAIAFAAALAFLPALRGGLVFDDHLLLGPTGLARGPLRDIWFSTAPLDWWPLSFTTLWADVRLWGAAPLPMHLENLLLHAAAAILLWRVLRALRVPGAFLGALLFAVHPVAVESVAWISERKNVLSAPLFFGSALAWLRFEERGGRRVWAVALALFALALLAKTSTVMLPVVLLGAAWARGSLDRRRLAALAPMFALALGAGLATLWFQAHRAAEGFLLAPRGPAERLGGAAWALLAYLWTAFVPAAAAVVYGPWPAGPRDPLFYLPLAACALGAALLWRFRRGRVRAAGLALAYHAAMVLPVLGLVDIAYFHVGPVSNHLQYLALAGPAALGGASLAWLAQRWGPRLPAAVAAALVLGLCAWTARRAAAFRDDVSLWEAAVRESPRSLYAVWMLSDRLADRGERARAAAALAAAAESSPDAGTRLRARALSLFHAGRVADALAAADEARSARPDPGFDLQLASLSVRARHPDEGLALLEPLLASGGRSPEVFYWAGAAHAQRGRRADAIRVLRDGVRAYPATASLRVALEALLAAGGAPPPP
ncbi:MAG TPA: hypothetical protein VF841_22130 [Anaeromyxobacter sp.]